MCRPLLVLRSHGDNGWRQVLPALTRPSSSGLSLPSNYACCTKTCYHPLNTHAIPSPTGSTAHQRPRSLSTLSLPHSLLRPWCCGPTHLVSVVDVVPHESLDVLVEVGFHEVLERVEVGQHAGIVL